MTSVVEARAVILDLGIGKAGSYLSQDEASVMRVGGDIRTKDLSRVRRKYNIPVVKMDAFLEPWADPKSKIPIPRALPFRDAVFDGVEVRFPHDELLQALTTKALWADLERIVKDGSSISVIFDVPPDGFRRLSIKGANLDIYKPESRIWETALEVCSRVHIERLTPEEVTKIGTLNAQRIGKTMVAIPDHKTYRLEALS